MKKTLLILIPILTLSNLAAGCRMAPRADGDAAGPSSPLIEAQDWYQLKYRAYGSEITLQSTGHFYVRPNACSRRAAGALKLDTWNRVATTINQAWINWRDWQNLQNQAGATPPSNPLTCVPVQSDFPALYSGITLQLRNDTTLTWIEPGSSRPCGRFDDDQKTLTLMRELIRTLGEVARIARSEGC